MKQSLVIQDPTNAATIYLFESLVDAALHATEWRGVFAFATKNGVEKLLIDDAFADFFNRGGTAALTVGIDAVTNRAALEALLALDKKYAGLTPTVFWTPNNSLFHPKLSHFRLDDGSERLIVGSGNLTPGGLQGNFEAYSVLTADAGEQLDTSELDEFYIRHAANIRPIDEAALDRAAKNKIKKIKVGTKIVAVEALDDEAPVAEEPAPALPLVQPVLIAQVPAAGGRWEQAHFNAAVIAQFFHVTDVEVHRVFLTYVQPDGTRGEEQPRRVVYSAANKNYKIEVENPGNRPYPQQGRPVLVIVQTGVRAFEYVLLMPGDGGHAAMFALTEQLPSVGKGLPRVITDAAAVQAAWLQAPFFMTAS